MSASIYPIRNRILIPPENEPFVAKYIPGFERNIVIMNRITEKGSSSTRTELQSRKPPVNMR
jgi:hypothetical protein